MRKPNNFDNVQTFGEFTPIELGGHILVIKQVKVEVLESGKEMVKIAFDTHATDKQPNYYNDLFKNDSRQDKKWQGVKIEWPTTAKGDANPFFKAFIEAVKKSNNGWEVQWDEKEGVHEKFEKCFMGKLVGGVFGKEEYLNNGETKMSTKCVQFRSVEAIKAGVPIPKDKLLNGSSSDNGDLTPINDGDMPF